MARGMADVAQRARLVTFIETELVRGRPGIDVERDALVDSGVIDSLGILKLVTHLERTFGVKLGDDELVPENFETLDAILALVGRARR
jgi:acyl carrier protein